jgi:hypothetical protein
LKVFAVRKKLTAKPMLQGKEAKTDDPPLSRPFILKKQVRCGKL